MPQVKESQPYRGSNSLLTAAGSAGGRTAIEPGDVLQL
jgi:hypothetical protein